MASLGLAYLDSSDSDPGSDCEIVPESPPALPISESLPTLPSTEIVPESPPALPSTPQMPLPPLSQQYDTPEDGINAINLLARPHGFAVSTLRSKTTKRGVRKTVRLYCDRGRMQRNRRPDGDPERKRQTTTLAIECPFTVSLRLNQETNLWHITIKNLEHNHGPSPASTHSLQRR
ncbi:hypothetical protein N7489_002006 [Penicillium chrysogenum]|uniref:FAR1 domain-containing protein n=1 Tax=Penicillium chrysogenum TaxID=5076 RepID=A0ABQ8WKF8_PENCH|nr:uncharacterized protein N7489_002006 [Penicillium chrysogenum]KAJ5251596.1 hypothetical protein N7489_002006 [Penicillium chrysogenum]KAJ5263024.1 hypothetical protein N7524_008329 [Penicillium chrysogenum]KAJ5270497.1 hypothetical protein N7505_006255 [Penicillium chrysogenum]KAJ6146751.1 hypothetical protein N7497_008733 [Penicillium chrysogenum]